MYAYPPVPTLLLLAYLIFRFMYSHDIVSSTAMSSEPSISYNTYIPWLSAMVWRILTVTPSSVAVACGVSIIPCNSSICCSVGLKYSISFSCQLNVDAIAVRLVMANIIAAASIKTDFLLYRFVDSSFFISSLSTLSFCSSVGERDIKNSFNSFLFIVISLLNH